MFQEAEYYITYSSGLLIEKREAAFLRSIVECEPMIHAELSPVTDSSEVKVHGL